MGNKTRHTANLVSDNNLFVDIANDRVGIGSTQPTTKLNVVGIVSATQFVGGGANITGISTLNIVNYSGGGGGGGGSDTLADVTGRGATTSSNLTLGGTVQFNNTIDVADNKILNFGASSDGRISYTSSTNRFYVRVPGGSGSLILGAGPAVRITNENGLTDRAVFTSSGVTVTGTANATTFSGSGAGLTSIPSSQLTGALPSIDGSNLTGITTSSSITIGARQGSALSFPLVGGSFNVSSRSGTTVINITS